MRILSSFIFFFTLFCLIIPAIADENERDDAYLRMYIKSIGIDKVLLTPVVVLFDKEGSKYLPIWIGPCEATSMQAVMGGMITDRPLTYDLIAALLRAMKARVNKVEITGLKDSIYHARLVISANNEVLTIDSRPSDAMIIASRMGVPVFVKKELVKRSVDIKSQIKQKI